MKLSKQVRLLVAADGLSASGKTTGAKLISRKYGLSFLSSGLLYRYISFRLLTKKNSANELSFIKKQANKITAKKLNDNKLFDPRVTQFSAIIAKSKKIRKLLRKYQKKFAKHRLVCIEGRDIGSIICPNADIKFFFKCSLKIRARRRWDEFRKKNRKISLKEVKKALKQRDSLDIHRKESPLKQVKDSILIDTSKLNKKQMLDKLSKVVEKKLKNKYGNFS